MVTALAWKALLVFAKSTLTDLAALGLTSNSETISYALSANGTEIVAIAGSGGRANPCFVVTSLPADRHQARALWEKLNI